MTKKHEPVTSGRPEVVLSDEAYPGRASRNCKEDGVGDEAGKENWRSSAKTFCIGRTATNADVCSGARCVRASSALVLVTNTGLTCRLRDKRWTIGNSDLHQVLERVDRGAWCCFALAATFAFLVLAFVPFASGRSWECKLRRPWEWTTCSYPCHEGTRTSQHVEISYFLLELPVC